MRRGEAEDSVEGDFREIRALTELTWLLKLDCSVELASSVALDSPAELVELDGVDSLLEVVSSVELEVEAAWLSCAV